MHRKDARNSVCAGLRSPVRLVYTEEGDCFIGRQLVRRMISLMGHRKSFTYYQLRLDLIHVMRNAFTDHGIRINIKRRSKGTSR